MFSSSASAPASSPARPSTGRPEYSRTRVAASPMQGQVAALPGRAGERGEGVRKAGAFVRARLPEDVPHVPRVHPRPGS